MSSRLLLRSLPGHDAMLSEWARGRDMQACFGNAPDLPGVVIVSRGGALRGFVSRRQFMELLSKPFRYDLYTNRRIASLMREIAVIPLVFAADAPISEAASAMVQRPPAEFSEPVVLRLDEGTFRIIDSQTLLAALVRNFAEQNNELQTAKDVIVESEKLASLGSLVAGVAHEVNTPLGVGIMAITTMQDELETLRGRVEAGSLKRSDLGTTMESLRDLSATALQTLNRAAELVRSFKQVSADQVSEARREFALEEELRDIMVSLRPMTKRSAIVLDLEPGPAVLMNSFPGALAQVLTNFVVNAFRHAFDGRESGIVNVSYAAKPGDMLRIRVRDNGNGIPRENLERIFEPFFTTKRGSGGTGLGLSIAYNLARARLGGMVTVESEAGVGACFTLDIPRAAPDVNPSAPH